MMVIHRLAVLAHRTASFPLGTGNIHQKWGTKAILTSGLSLDTPMTRARPVVVGWIYAHNNQITQLHPDRFRSNMALCYLEISNNPLGL